MIYSTKLSNKEGLLEKEIKARDYCEFHPISKSKIRKLKSLSNNEINEIIDYYMNNKIT